jgi:hypothetical protein
MNKLRLVETTAAVSLTAVLLSGCEGTSTTQPAELSITTQTAQATPQSMQSEQPQTERQGADNNSEQRKQQIMEQINKYMQQYAGKLVIVAATPSPAPDKMVTMVNPEPLTQHFANGNDKLLSYGDTCLAANWEGAGITKLLMLDDGEQVDVYNVPQRVTDTACPDGTEFIVGQ